MKNRLIKTLSIIACMALAAAYSMPAFAGEAVSSDASAGSKTATQQLKAASDRTADLKAKSSEADTAGGSAAGSDISSREDTAADSQSDDISVNAATATGEAGDLKWELSDDGTLIVTGTGNMPDYNLGETPWWDQRNDIKVISIGEGVTSIGTDAFIQCDNLTEITMPSTLKQIGSYAFNTCTKLKSVELGVNIEKIGVSAFEYCHKLAEASIYNDSIEIESGAFNDTAGDFVVKCNPGSAAWYYAVEQGLNHAALEECSGDHTWSEEYTVDKAPTFEDAGAKSIHCTKCDAVKDGTEVSIDKFSEIKGQINENTAWSLDKDGVLTISGKGACSGNPWKNYRYDLNCPSSNYESFIVKVIISDGVTSIKGGVFCDFDYTNLKEAEIAGSVASIGEGAFAYCENLTDVRIDGTDTALEDDVFKGTNENLVIRCHLGSKAWDYAKANNIKCLSIEKCSTHTWDSGKVTIEPTCTEKGSKLLTCEICGETGTEEIPALGHNYKDKKITVQPTCSREGIKIVVCTVCDDYSTEYIDKIPHKYESVVKKAGYLKNGSSYKLCSVCGAKASVKTLAGYSSYVTRNFSVSAGRKSFTAKWSKAGKSSMKKMTGYQIRYSASKSMSGARYAYAGKTAVSKTVKKLSSKKTYYVQVRNYIKSGGKTYYSKTWSSIKKVKTK